MKTIKDINIVLEDNIIFGDITFSDTIKNIHYKSGEVKGASYIVPGFIDVHIHGSASHDAMDASFEAIKGMAQSLLKEGTTAFLPTTMTQSSKNIELAVKNIYEYTKTNPKDEARILGIHLEGPYMNKAAAGAQPLKYIKAPNLDEFKRWQKASGNLIKKVSYAPENAGAIAFTRYLKEEGIIPSIAHTKATYEIVKEAMDAGASSLTHTYNAMTSLHHRNVGVVGAGLLHPELSCELIYDRIHVLKEAAEILIKAKGSRGVILITDSMRNKGMPEGISELGGQVVYIKNNEARLEDGTLAGSILKMINGYQHLIEDFSLSLVEASHMASLNPAFELGVDHLYGSIKENKKADLLILDSKYQLKETIIDGKTVYEAK